MRRGDILTLLVPMLLAFSWLAYRLVGPWGSWLFDAIMILVILSLWTWDVAR